MSEQQVQRIYKVNDEGIYGFFKEHRFLSNFHEEPASWNNLLFRSNEGAYQAAKCANLNDQRGFISATAAGAKVWGRKVEIRSDWEDVKNDVMFVINWNKYYHNIGLRNLLLRTGDKYLEETNWWGDRVWGVCDGVGENRLGKILMRVRQLLR